MGTAEDGEVPGYEEDQSRQLPEGLLVGMREVLERPQWTAEALKDRLCRIIDHMAYQVGTERAMERVEEACRRGAWTPERLLAQQKFIGNMLHGCRGVDQLEVGMRNDEC